MLRVGIIGCGGMGRDHIRRLTEKIQGAEVVAVSDVFEESAKKAAEICGAKVYTDSRELINAEDVDAVFIVSPGFAHVDSLLQAIEAGKRIFCEKPLCTTAEDCLKVVKAEEAAGKHLIQLGFMRRYDKGYQQIKEALATGEYGEPLILHCTHRNPEVGTNYNTPMAVHDTAIHEIDVLHWLVDDEYESAQVVMPRVTKYSHSELKDPQIMMLRTKKGVCIDVEVFVNCKFGYDINCEVVCEDGALKMAQPAYPSIRKNAAVSSAIDTDCFVRFKDAYDKEVQDWVDNAEAGVITGPNAWDGYLAAISVSDTDPLKVPAATPTPSPAPKKKEQHLRAKIVSVSTSTMTVVPQTTGSELTVPLTSVPVYFKGGMAPGSYVNIIYTGKFNGESTNGMKIRGITGEDPDTLSIRNISSTVTGTILGTTANTVLIQTYDGVKILCSRENVQDLSTSGMEEGADLRVTFNPAKSRTSNIYSCIKFEDP